MTERNTATKLTSQQLHAAIASLPDKQAKRIYAHYFMGMSKTAIAKAEGVSEKAVRIGIDPNNQSSLL
ncbi:RNA polymerase sigma factor [Marinisporobacter balticus]|uniref:Sigma-70-like protein n=1 Tax=Marinisporobacter balticus TaxID=2018667 RepID=A0A4R2K7Y1_9FIRM|nr:sigma-70-like protein [Marinisporobacter balticus]